MTERIWDKVLFYPRSTRSSMLVDSVWSGITWMGDRVDLEWTQMRWELIYPSLATT